MYHVELRQRPNEARAFNLTDEQLRTQLLEPLLSRRPFEFGGHEWEGLHARVRILEGRKLAPNELLLGRGWSNAEKYGTDVTERLLGGARAEAQRRALLQRLSERILGRIAAGPLELNSAVALADDLFAGQPASNRFATTAEAAWELLHRRQADLLDEAGARIRREQWQEVLLGWASQADDQATTSAISLARSESDANR